MNQINDKELSFLVECEECKYKFRISSNKTACQIHHKKEFNIDGKPIFLTYYDCPNCGKRYCVQIDDAISLGKFYEVNKMFIKLSIAKRNYEEISKKQSAKFKKARKNLSDYRMNLMKDYTGKLAHDNETDSDFVLRFFV